MVDRMRSYTAKILNGNIELELKPFTLGLQIEHKSTFDQLGVKRPPKDADPIDVQVFLNANLCNLFFTLCEAVHILGDTDIPDLDMFAELWQASKGLNPVERWELWQDYVTITVATDLDVVIGNPDPRLQAPPALQSTEKKMNVPSL